MEITVADICLLILATAATTGLLVILSAAVTGYLVFRTRKEAHEPLFPAKPRKRNGPIVIDEFAEEAKKDDERGLPDVILDMNRRMMSQMAAENLKKGKENG